MTPRLPECSVHSDPAINISRRRYASMQLDASRGGSSRTASSARKGAVAFPAPLFATVPDHRISTENRHSIGDNDTSVCYEMCREWVFLGRSRTSKFGQGGVFLLGWQNLIEGFSRPPESQRIAMRGDPGGHSRAT